MNTASAIGSTGSGTLLFRKQNDRHTRKKQ